MKQKENKFVSDGNTFEFIPKHDKQLAINGSFDDVIKVSVTPGKPAPAPKPVKPKKEKG